MSDHTPFDVPEPRSEYWVREIMGVTSEVVATFPTHRDAEMWAEDNYKKVYDGPPVGAHDGAFITEVKRFE